MITLTLSETGVLPPICHRHHTCPMFPKESARPVRQTVERKFRCQIISVSRVGRSADYLSPPQPAIMPKRCNRLYGSNGNAVQMLGNEYENLSL